MIFKCWGTQLRQYNNGLSLSGPNFTKIGERGGGDKTQDNTRGQDQNRGAALVN